jgi:hypothetical protein
MGDFLQGLEEAKTRMRSDDPRVVNELEVRYKNISRYQFDRLLKELQQIGLPSDETYTEDKIGEGRIRETTNPITDEKIYIKKREIFGTGVDAYGISLSVSREITVSPEEFSGVTVVRTKHRYSFKSLLDDGSPRYTFDLTEATTQTKSQAKKELLTPTYEVEIELNAPQYLEQFREAAKWVWSVLYDSPLLYKLADDPKQSLGMLRRPEVFPLQMRNINKEYMEGMYITRLLKGKRRFLFVNENGFWLISPDVTSALLSRRTAKVLKGTMLDGVYLEELKHFAVFDCLVTRTGNWIRAPLVSRLVEAQRAVDDIRSMELTNLVITTLSAERVDSSFGELTTDLPRPGFFDQVNNILDNGADGFILRKGTDNYYSWVVKWQRPEDLSVDLLLTWDLTPQGQRAKVSPWMKVDLYSIPKDIPSETIVRFRGTGMRFDGARYDKRTPDSERYVKAMKYATFFPITERAIRAADTSLLDFHLRQMIEKHIPEGASVMVSEEFADRSEIYRLKNWQEGKIDIAITQREKYDAETLFILDYSSTALSELFRPSWGLVGGVTVAPVNEISFANVNLTLQTPSTDIAKIWKKRNLYRVEKLNSQAFLSPQLYSLGQLYVLAIFSPRGLRYHEKKQERTLEQRCYVKSLVFESGKDVFEEIPVSWAKGVYRIATIGDGSCLVHAVLKSINDEYGEETRYRNKSRQAKALRTYLADRIKDKSFYRQLGGGSFQELSQQVPEFKQSNLMKLFKSDEWLGNEAFVVMTAALGFSLIVVNLCDNELVIYDQPYWAKDEEKSPVVIVLATTQHYETIAIDETGEGVLSTRFDRHHPLVEVLLLPTTKEREEYMNKLL